MKNKRIHLFTASYPHGTGESFLSNEIKYLFDGFDELFLYPFEIFGPQQKSFNKKGEIRYFESTGLKLNYLDLFFIVKLFFHEWFFSKNKVFMLKKCRRFYAMLKKSMILAKWIETQNFDQSDGFYSYWMNEWALALTILRKKRKINKFVIRVNGYDIWENRHEGKYVPFRYLIYSQVEKVVTLSRTSELYLKELKVFPEKIERCYFGTEDFGFIEQKKSSEFVVFTCSSAIPLKRLEKIAAVICTLNFKVKWHHHGDGPVLNEIKQIMAKAPENVSFSSTAKINDYNEVLNLQKSLAPDLVINLSSSEGLPVTLIEAISFGIPILANNVGACGEIVNKITGVLVDKEASIMEISNVIQEMRLMKYTRNDRLKIREFWFENFSAEKNYTKFAQDLQIIFK